MKSRIISVIAVAATCVSSVVSQTVSPTGTLEGNKLSAKTDTFYVNDTWPDINNYKTESLGVGIAANDNVIIGWEDDGSGLTDLEAVWILYDSSGVSITPDTTITSVNPVYAGQTLNSKYLSYFRADKSAVAGYTSWGPKIKANLFGDGIGMGATAFDLGKEVTQLSAIQLDAGGGGDFPAVQLLDNSGAPLGIVAGVTDADAEPAGDIRVADWDYLSNGNVVIVGESRQDDDLVSKYGGAAAGKHAIFRIVDQAGQEVKAVGLVSETTNSNEIWHGVGVVKNGFGIRFAQGGRTIVRLFDNNGNPTSTNIDIGNMTGNEVAAQGGRGDSAGFHGNANDAYVVVNGGADNQGVKQVWVTVLNANGALRYSKAVADDLDLLNIGRVDAAINSNGRVFVAFSASIVGSFAPELVMGRVFDPTGAPLGNTFFVGELETDIYAYSPSRNPRVTSRGDYWAVVWESENSIALPTVRVVAARLFANLFTPGSIESVGLTRIVPDTPIINPGLNALGNWEPYSSVLGNSVFLIECNTFAESSFSLQRYVVALQPVAGGPMKLGEGFYADNGAPYKGPINASRQNGNPGRVGGDKRPGAVNFMVGGEASPHVYPEFQSDNRWNLGVDRGLDGRYGTVQAYSLNPVTLEQTPLVKAFDAINGRLTEGQPAVAPEIGRFGGDIAGLDNGNFVVVVDDRSNFHATDRSPTAVIVAPDGTIVKESFSIGQGDQIWANVAAYRGGFAARFRGVIYFFDNNGNLKGQVDQDTSSGVTFDRGRGDGTRIAAHINSPYVFLAGKHRDSATVKIAAWDSRNQQFIAVADVSEAGFPGNVDRVNMAADALNRVVVTWESLPAGYEKNQVAARVLVLDGTAKSITPLTKSFLPFINAAQTGNIRTYRMTVSMTTREIMVAAKGEINLQNKPENGADSPGELNFYTVISHPNPKDDPTPPMHIEAGPQLYDDPAGGWLYVLTGNKATAGAPDSGFTSLDETWSHDNGSDAWDGSAIGGALGDANRPGGVSSIDGYLRLQDTGDPRDHGFSGDSPIPSNRKIYFGKNITSAGASGSVLNDGVTLLIRARVPTSGTLDDLHPDGGGATQPYPATGDGYLIHDGGKGNFGIKQANGGVVSFSLATEADTGSVAGLLMNNLNGTTITGDVDSGEAGTANVLALNPTAWHEFWITIQADDTSQGTHKVTVYLDGNLDPQTFIVTAGSGSDFSDISYIAMGVGSTGQSGALDVDYFKCKLGALAPTGSAVIKITGITVAGGNATITWTGGKSPYTVQRTTALTGQGATWEDVTTTDATSATIPVETDSAFYRIAK